MRIDWKKLLLVLACWIVSMLLGACSLTKKVEKSNKKHTFSKDEVNYDKFRRQDSRKEVGRFHW